MQKLFLYIACSLDGYIAKNNNDLSFLKMVEKEGEDYGYQAFTATIGTIILGRKTYDWVAKEIGTEHYDNGPNKVYVITRTERAMQGKTIFYTGNLEKLVVTLKKEELKHIYCDGGAEVIDALLQNKLIDEFIISIVPVLLGNGIRLFKEDGPEQKLELVNVKTYETGLTQLHYKKKTNL